MRQVFATAALAALLALSGCSSSIELNGSGPEGQPLVAGQAHTLASSVLDESRAYWVSLPRSYSDGPHKRYPVLYVLDGETRFQTASAVAAHMGPHQIPELIVVAISTEADRSRDLSPTHSIKGPDGKTFPVMLENTGGGDAFLDFVQTELIPAIESDYRTNGQRVLAGHSIGGTLTLHALLNRPEIFDRYIAMDPSLWWDDELLLRQAEANAAKETTGAVYVSYAQNAKDPFLAPDSAGRRFGTLMEQGKSKDLRFTQQYFADEVHGSVPMVSLYYGLRSVFHGHEPPAR